MNTTHLIFAILWLSFCWNQSGFAQRGKPWQRYTIDDTSRGADGVRLADVNQDGQMDLVTGWEEGGKVRVYLHPGAKRVREPWPNVTVGQVASPEDAVFADLDDDGQLDVVSCCEGKTKSVFVHWAPKQAADYLVADAWRTEAFPALHKKAAWMYCLPMRMDHQHGTDLVLAAKNQGAEVGWLAAPRNPHDIAAWKWNPLKKVGWVMSLEQADLNQDQRMDILMTDRKGPDRGLYWFEHPRDLNRTWKIHSLSDAKREVMFLGLGDLNADRHQDIAVATSGHGTDLYFRTGNEPQFECRSLEQFANTGTGKAAACGDLNLDGQIDLVLSCEKANPPKSGVIWAESQPDGSFVPHEISGPAGIKFDLLQLLDLDSDGDLDVLTCEERANLGLIWYENPTKE